MDPSEHTIAEPPEYEAHLERLRNERDPLKQHNGAIDLLRRAQIDRSLTDDTKYDPLIEALRRFEQQSGERLARLTAQTNR